jgi:hypothetical protein
LFYIAGKLALKEALSRHEDILSIKKSEGIDEDTGMYVGKTLATH